MKFKILTVTLTASVSLCLSTQASAQDFFTQTVAVQPMFMNNIMTTSTSRSKISEQVRLDLNDLQSSVPTDSSAMEFSASQSTRKKIYSAMIEKARATDPSHASQMSNILNNTDIVAQIGNVMGPMGLQSNNVADSYTLWWVIAWQAANKRQDEPSRQMMSAVKQQAANALLQIPAFASANNSDKQEIAESFLMQAALIDAHIDAAAGNASQQEALAKAVNQGAKTMGLDLTTMDLTENGFVPRSGGRSDAADAVEGADPSAVPTEMAANDNVGSGAGESDTGKLALYGVGGVALLAGMFALGKSFGGKG